MGSGYVFMPRRGLCRADPIVGRRGHAPGRVEFRSSRPRHNPPPFPVGGDGRRERMMDTTNSDAAFWIAGYTDSLRDVVGTADTTRARHPPTVWRFIAACSGPGATAATTCNRVTGRHIGSGECGGFAGRAPGDRGIHVFPDRRGPGSAGRVPDGHGPSASRPHVDVRVSTVVRACSQRPCSAATAYHGAPAGYAELNETR